MSTKEDEKLAGVAEDPIADEIIDVEAYGREGREKPIAKKYKIRIDKSTFVVDVPEMTGRELLVLAGKRPPERYQIYEKLRGGERREIPLDKKASFRAPGVERFLTLPLDQTEGGR